MIASKLINEHESMTEQGVMLNNLLTDFVDQLLYEYKDYPIVEFEHVLIGSVINCCDAERKKRSIELNKRKNQIIR